jgi:hypothetical protein
MLTLNPLTKGAKKYMNVNPQPPYKGGGERDVNQQTPAFQPGRTDEESREIIDSGDEIISWDIDEYDKHERTRRWYFIASTVSLALLIFSFWTGDFLFAVIIVIGALILILREGQEPAKINFSITDEGLIVGKKFYDYDEIKDFSIIYKPRIPVKNIYFEFKTSVRPRLSIPLIDLNPLPIREILLKYLTEDLERTDQPVSEFLGKLFKI